MPCRSGVSWPRPSASLSAGGEPCGTFRVGSLETVAALRLPPILAAFAAACPRVDVRIQTGTTAELVAAVLQHRLDGARGRPDRSRRPGRGAGRRRGTGPGHATGMAGRDVEGGNERGEGPGLPLGLLLPEDAGGDPDRAGDRGVAASRIRDAGGYHRLRRGRPGHHALAPRRGRAGTARRTGRRHPASRRTIPRETVLIHRRDALATGAMVRLHRGLP